MEPTEAEELEAPDVLEQAEALLSGELDLESWLAGEE